jgi:predicted Zn-dependent peptidase
MGAKSAQNNAEAQAEPAPAAPAPATAPTAPEAAESAQIEELKQLAALKDQGILSEEEFAAKKEQVLGL